MKKLDKTTLDDLQGALDKATEAYSGLEELITDLRNDIEEKVAAINERITSINEAGVEAEGIFAQAAEAVEEYIGDKSEKWQEGEKGQAYSAWLERLQSIQADCVDIDEVEIEIPDAPDAPGWMFEVREGDPFTSIDDFTG